MNRLGAYQPIKRALDVVVSIGIVFGLLPVWIVIGILIKCESPGPLFFKQQRMGKGSKPFVIYKFRSMHTSAPAEVPTLELNDPEVHITRIGAFLRKTSLDEIPQLVNILKGEMSLIGPRPVILSETLLIERRRELGADQLLPGVTGWAQINGRDTLDAESKAQLDYEYLQNASLAFDLKIVLLTLRSVVRQEHISH